MSVAANNLRLTEKIVYIDEIRAVDYPSTSTHLNAAILFPNHQRMFHGRLSIEPQPRREEQCKSLASELSTSAMFDLRRTGNFRNEIDYFDSDFCGFCQF